MHTTGWLFLKSLIWPSILLLLYNVNVLIYTSMSFTGWVYLVIMLVLAIQCYFFVFPSAFQSCFRCFRCYGILCDKNVHGDPCPNKEILTFMHADCILRTVSIIEEIRCWGGRMTGHLMVSWTRRIVFFVAMSDYRFRWFQEKLQFYPFRKSNECLIKMMQEIIVALFVLLLFNVLLENIRGQCVNELYQHISCF